MTPLTTLVLKRASPDALLLSIDRSFISFMVLSSSVTQKHQAELFTSLVNSAFSIQNSQAL